MVCLTRDRCEKPRKLPPIRHFHEPGAPCTTTASKGAFRMDHPASGDESSSRCDYYRRICDLPAAFDPSRPDRIVMPTTTVWGLIMPTALGQAVQAEMRKRQAEPGPILSHPRSHRWTFLIQPDLPEDDRSFAEMFRSNVSVVRTGGTIALPGPSERGAEFRVWVEPPRSAFRPSGRAVLDAVRACGPNRERRTAASA